MMPPNQTALLPYCYLAPVDYYVALLKYPAILFEAQEHFVKQTYRSRCCIYGPNGIIKLIIPVQHTGERTKMKDVRIAYAERWQKLHWRSLEAAYRSSPYFEYYEDDFAPFYQKKFDFLVDFNEQLQSKILELMKIEITSSKTTSYKEEYPNATDFRDAFNPKSKLSNLNSKILNPPAESRYNREKADPKSKTPHYAQVFGDRHGFIPNLSITDLLFNEGPNSVDYLRKLLPSA